MRDSLVFRLRKVSTAILISVLSLGTTVTAQVYTGNTGDRIDIRTGSLQIDQVDLQLNGRHGLDIVLTRSYNSNLFEYKIVDSAHQKATYVNAKLDDPSLYRYLGVGWRIEYPHIERKDPDTSTFDGTTGYWMVNANGSAERFYNTFDIVQARGHTFSHRLRNQTRVSPNAAVLTDGTLWEFGHLVGTKRFLSRIINRFNDTLRVDYHENSAWIKRVVSPIGREVTFHYCNGGDSLYNFEDVPDATARLREVRYLNHLGDTLSISYRFNANKNLQYVIYQNNDTATFEYTNQFLYADSANYTHKATPPYIHIGSLAQPLLRKYIGPGSFAGDSVTYAYHQFSSPVTDCLHYLSGDYNNVDISVDFRSVIGVYRRRYRARYDTFERMISARTLSTAQGWPCEVGMQINLTHPTGLLDEYFFFIDTYNGEWSPECRGTFAGTNAGVHPGALFHVNNISSTDTVATGYDYSSRNTPERAQIGIRYDSVAIWDPGQGEFTHWSVDTVRLYVPTRRLEHIGVPYYNPAAQELGPVEMTDSTGQDIFVSQLTMLHFDTSSIVVNFEKSGERLNYDFLDAEIQVLSSGYWESPFGPLVVVSYDTTYTVDSLNDTTIVVDSSVATYQNSMYPDSLMTDEMYFAEDTIIEYEYVEDINAVLVKKSRHRIHDDTLTTSIIKEFTYDTSAGYQLSTLTTYFDTTYHDDTTRLVSSYFYDSSYNLSYEISPYEDTTFYEWDTINHAWLWKQSDSSLGTIATYDYYPNGLAKSVTDLNGATTHYRYTHLSDDSVVILPLEDTTSFTTRKIRVNSHEIRTETKIDDSIVIASTAYTNGLHRMVKSRLQVSDSVYIFDSTLYDSYGNVRRLFRSRYNTDTTSPYVWTQLFYDDKSQLVKTLYPDSSYDSTASRGSFTSVSFGTDGDSVFTTVDIWGNVLETTVFDTNDVALIAHMEYNLAGQLTGITDRRGLKTTCEYDELGRRTSITHPDVGTTKAWYNRRGLARFVKAGSSDTAVYFLYDSDNRLIEEGTLVNVDTTKIEDVAYPDSATAKIARILYRYDDYPDSASAADTAGGLGYSKGRLTYIVDSAATTILYYDAMGQIRKRSQKIIGFSDFATVEFDYYQHGEIKRVTYPDGRFTDYEYDRAGRVDFVSEVFGRDSVEYTAWGAVNQIEYSNGVRSLYDYDVVGRLKKQRNINQLDNLWHRSYDYQNDFLVKEYDLDSLGDTTSLGLVRSYAYDRLGRLDSAWYKDVNSGTDTGTIRYDYDSNQNLLLKQILAGDSLVYLHYDGTNRDSVIKQGSTTHYLIHDERGRLTKLVTVAGLEHDSVLIKYDYRDLPVEIRYKKGGGHVPTCNGKTIYNYYDFAGRKVRQKVLHNAKSDVWPYPCETAENNWYYLYSGDLMLCEWAKGTAAPKPDSIDYINIYGLGKRLARKWLAFYAGSDSLRILITDYRGNVKSELKTNGVTGAQNVEYYPYGEVLSVAGAQTTRFGNESKETDYTNWQDFGPRYYHPMFGRFLAPDPALAGPSAYEYARGNPIVFTDPSGMYSVAAYYALQAAADAQGYNRLIARMNAEESFYADEHRLDGPVYFESAPGLDSWPIDRRSTTSYSWGEVSTITSEASYHGQVISRCSWTQYGWIKNTEPATIGIHPINITSAHDFELTPAPRGSNGPRSWGPYSGNQPVSPAGPDLSRPGGGGGSATGGFAGWLDGTQLALDGVGLIPGAELADLANAAISLARGNYTDAGLSCFAAVPILGNFATAGKLTKKARKLLKTADKLYPKKVGRFENHHEIPKYISGTKKGTTVRIPSAYHQLITNEFRALWGYGKGPVESAEELRKILDKVYTKYPIPTRPGYYAY